MNLCNVVILSRFMVMKKISFHNINMHDLFFRISFQECKHSIGSILMLLQLKILKLDIRYLNMTLVI